MMSTTEGDLDVEVSHEREEGELEDSDVEDDTYIRPEAFNPPSFVNMQIQDEMSDEPSSEDSSCSDSDEEPSRKAKRTKLRLRRSHQQQQQPTKQNKYNIWCKTVQEDLLTENMVSCDVSKKHCYGVESYDYTIEYRLNDKNMAKKILTKEQTYNRDQASNKRKHIDRTNVKLRLGKRVNPHQPQNDKQKPRYLPDLNVTLEDPVENITVEISEKLAEEKKELVGRFIQVLGASKAIEIYKETQRVEADGGMLVRNGTRRRTPGGVYFFLLKHDDEISQSMINQIFNEDRKETARKIKKSRARSRQKVMEQLKQSLTDSELPSLLSRGEATVQSEHGSNPPPSPATDARDCSSDTDAHSHTDAPPLSPPGLRVPLPHRTDSRQLQNYDDDDFLEVMCNEDMDLF